MGFEFVDRDINDNCIVHLTNPQSQALETVGYKLLNICEFNSTRKRMSCIFERNGQITLMCKGADSIIYELLRDSSKRSLEYEETQRHVDQYANEGLRTLFLAERTLSREEYDAWNEKVTKAKEAMNEELVSKINSEIEVELELIGSTAIEDKLQDEVQDTINFLKNAGIKVWVLTGDKVETAINIGISAGLLDQDMTQHIIQQDEHANLQRELAEVEKLVE